ncbi:MAG: sensor histidine kinase [Coraliomargarita sp.]
MTLFFAILALGASLALWTYISKTRKMVRDLEEAVRSERRLLLEESSARLKKLGFTELVVQINSLVDRYNEIAQEESGYSNQIEAVLGSIQEAVLIFDSSRTIQFANESAQRLFQHGRILKGSRLESVMRSSSLLEFLGEPGSRQGAQLRQISLDWKGEALWFEASCADVRGRGKDRSFSTILVLHDITRLKSLEMVRRDFVANVSHELRTPLTIIKGFAETLVEDNASLPVAARARFLDKILNNAERLHVLVEDLLTLSRLESKPDQMEEDQHSLKQLLADTIENYRSRLDAKRQQLVLEFDDQIGDFSFDRFRINQVVDNLVENAFRYAPDFTLLALCARYDEANNMVECCVRDDGPGIPEKDVPHIFERFYRVDKGRSRETGGTGLGLSIMKHIIQLHGGTVRAESKLGEGTAIYFALPYSAAAKSEASA